MIDYTQASIDKISEHDFSQKIFDYYNKVL